MPMTDWRDQTFGVFYGNCYLVGEAFDLLPPGTEPKEIPLAILERNFSEASCEEPLGSDAFWARANACDMTYPLLVVESDYLWVVDGVHRLFRARAEGWKTIKAYVLPVAELRKLKPLPYPEAKPPHVDKDGTYHCPKCRQTHRRGPVNGLNAYRCLSCGETHTAYKYKPESILTPLLLEDALEWIRQRCWTVAVHNDYHLKGMLHTFWLFTKGNACIKGEGRTDLEALEQVMAQIREGIKCEVAGEEESRNAP